MTLQGPGHTGGAAEFERGDSARRRAAMVARLAAQSVVGSAPVLAAIAAVQRHLFLPGASLDRVYSAESVVTHRTSDGVALSSASEVGTVAAMLGQLDVRAGHRVLEIGAGTGYNAALLRYLVGSQGSVVTVDILEEAATEAREHLHAAGYGDVAVIWGDGEDGAADHGPFDRIIATAGVWDLSPAWADQLAPGGVLVAPLRMNGLTRSIAFGRAGGSWRSRDLMECGFMPMRGAGQVGEQNVMVRGQTGLVVRTDRDAAFDETALVRALDSPAPLVWSGVATRHGVVDDLDFWLSRLDGFCRIIMMGGAVPAGLVEPQYPWGSMGVATRDSLAYLTTRAIGYTRDVEIGVCGYGPEGEHHALQMADRIRAWHAEMHATGDHMWVEVHPFDAADVPHGLLRLRKRYNQVIVGRAAPDSRPMSAPV